MKLIRRIAVGTATAGVGLALAFGPATAAFADGPDTSKRTVQTIEGSPWVKLEQGDREYRVAAVRCFLDEFGYYADGCLTSEELGDQYTVGLTAAVRNYQEDNDLPVTGNVDVETWGSLRDDVGQVEPGDDRSDVVRGLQYSLNILGDAIVVDGQYGERTTTAVKNFQEHKDIDSDGIVGPITFRAMYAQGAEG